MTELADDKPTPARRRPERNRVLALIAVYKYAKALALIAVGLGALQLVRADVREQARSIFEALGSSVDVVPVLRVLRNLGALAPNRLRLVGVGAFVYAALFVTEGTGLWLQQRWAEYLTVIATASFIPFEIFELARRLTVPRVSALVINVGVLLYLVWLLRRSIRAESAK